MHEDANIINVIKHSIVAKAARGRYINVRGLLRDLQQLNDFEVDATQADANQKQLVELLSGKSNTSDSRLDAIEAKLDALISD